MNTNIKKLLLILVIALLALSACDALSESEQANGALRGSGYISVQDVGVSTELGGKVSQVLVEEGQFVEAGTLLFQLDDTIYQAQYQQALAAVGLAEAAVATAQAQVESAEIQQAMVVQGIQFRQQPFRTVSWLAPQPETFDLPAWYYADEEYLAAAQSEVDDAAAALQIELQNLSDEMAAASSADLVALEKELAQARTTLQIAQQTLLQAQTAQDDRLESIAQEAVNAAEAALESLQIQYDRMLTSGAVEDLLDVRGRAAIAQARYDNAIDLRNQLQSGDQSLEIAAAQTGVQLAETGLAQAQAGLTQAQAAVGVLEATLEKTRISSPISGFVLARNLEAGEVIGAGSQSLIIGPLDQVELIVYIPEDRYGQVTLGQAVEITVDSFPGETFDGSVVRIADQAEFTPRNVQTVDGRKSTVYAVFLQVPNPDLKLKPGMPADAILDTNP